MKWSEPKRKDSDSLQAHIGWYATEGFVVESQTETSALLVKPKGGFSTGWFIFSWIVPGPGAIIYVIYHHFIKRKRVVDLYVEDGKVKRR